MKTILNLSDEKFIHLVNENRDINKVRQLINDSIDTVESGDVLIGLDITDLEVLFENYKELHIGMVNSKDTSNSTRLVEKLIESTDADVANYNRVYLYLKGDVSLIDVNAVATTLQEQLGEAVNIVFTATYNETIPDEYDVMALFLYKGEK